MKRLIMWLLVCGVSVPLLLEGMLRVIDPWGIHYYADLDWVVQQEFFPDGIYHVPSGRWNFSIVAGRRRVPDSQPADCQIAAIGDSVTFGYGVQDGDTWVNGLAQHFPEVEFLNLGIVGYNTAQVYARARAIPADGYIYLIVYNDSEQPMVFGERYYRWYAKTYLMRYRDTYRKWQQTRPIPTFETFGEAPPEPILYFLYGEMAGVPPSAQPIPLTHRISAIDEHPNATGHEAIAAAMQDEVGAFIQQVCEAS